MKSVLQNSVKKLNPVNSKLVWTKMLRPETSEYLIINLDIYVLFFSQTGSQSVLQYHFDFHPVR